MKKPLEIEIINYEKPIKELIGKTIFDVNYYEIDYGEPLWNETEFHSLDYGIEIITSDKNAYYFIWGNEFTQYDVKFRKGNISTEFSNENGAKKHNVKDNQNWSELCGKKIIGIESFWSYWSLINDKKRKYYPQDVRIEFENGKEIWISAFEFRDNTMMQMQDHITIFFDKETAEKYKIGIKNVG
ncbi:hypothetical protein RRF68_04865 [Tenacibaculum sp. HL-MS23]|uniref:hypothetical protein n=1 Tax=Tenacibaculum sp. HL-MS23 TaxID=3077734 RepID=UPI0028FC105F|nr:hypothetical protein [Tenacibaculum sp. HL-MS23]WNW02744.1 hypothetical protein RRF68_04865 [Tenacibaculum sp. HL-MS23]